MLSKKAEAGSLHHKEEAIYVIDGGVASAKPFCSQPPEASLCERRLNRFRDSVRSRGMSTEVHVLSQTLINKIAAGEVIVRPASVVKELVENSFDAGATRIRVEVDKEVQSISVTDDGCGMDESNAKRAILRNSTSKISDFDDLERLMTRGFRGEALASIISVSRFELITRRREDMAGVRLLADGGQVQKIEPVGAAEGTTIHVRELFYNTPARRKFLKKPAAEYNMLVHLMTQQALSHPDVGLACGRDGKMSFDLPAGQDLRSRIEDLLGATVQGKLIEVDFEREGLSVRGYVCRPEASRKDRRWQFLMVNGRPIGIRQLSFPIQQAYHGLLMKQRFPIVVLDIGIDPSEVDVNVHPTKEEVRFGDERKVGGLLHRAVNQALMEQNLMPTLTLPEGAGDSFRGGASEAGGSPGFVSGAGGGAVGRGYSPPGGGFAQGDDDPSMAFVRSNKGVEPFLGPSGMGRSNAEREMFPARDFMTPPVASSPTVSSADEFPYASSTGGVAHHNSANETQGDAPVSPAEGVRLRLGEGLPPEPLGQVALTYIMAEWGDDLLMIDQHAAHERLLYQRFLERPREKAPSQPLLIPIELEVPPVDRGAFEEICPLLEEMGLAVEDAGDGAFVATALPADFDSLDAAAMVRDMLDEVRQLGEKNVGVDELRDRVLIRMACHAAIKAGQKLHPQEMRRLMRDIAEARLSFTCPHGRPTMVLLRKEQLDRQFGRIVS